MTDGFAAGVVHIAADEAFEVAVVTAVVTAAATGQADA